MKQEASITTEKGVSFLYNEDQRSQLYDRTKGDVLEVTQTFKVSSLWRASPQSKDTSSLLMGEDVCIISLAHTGHVLRYHQRIPLTASIRPECFPSPFKVEVTHPLWFYWPPQTLFANVAPSHVKISVLLCFIVSIFLNSVFFKI